MYVPKEIKCLILDYRGELLHTAAADQPRTAPGLLAHGRLAAPNTQAKETASDPGD